MINHSDLTPRLSKNRILWIDTAKAIGIFLVFYGHVLEPLIKFNSTAFLQFKFVAMFWITFECAQASNLFRLLKDE